MIFCQLIHGETKAFSQKDRQPFLIASGCSGIHCAGACFISLSVDTAPQPGQQYHISEMSNVLTPAISRSLYSKRMSLKRIS